MSAAAAGGEAGTDQVRTTRQFRKFNASPRLSPEQLRRQNDVLQSAWRHFGLPGPVVAFLNAKNAQLEGGQPLCLAIESDVGLQRVERLLNEMTRQA